MIISSMQEFETHKARLLAPTTLPSPKRILMADPEHFDVAYSINPYMQDKSGALKKVDRPLARKQWQKLFETYSSLGMKPEVLRGKEGLYDIVFAANQSFPFWHEKTDKPQVIMSRMRSEFRRPEVALFKRWYQDQGYTIHELPSSELCFEGNGDALLHPGRRIIWGGAGPRTDAEVYREISQITGMDVVLLKLQDPQFYHLDTCFSVLNSETVALYPGGFTADSLAMIRAAFPNVIETIREDCEGFFTGNCHSPDGRDVVLHQGCGNFEEKLKLAGLTTHPVDTSEYMKSGGSVFCMKMMVF